MRCRNGRRHHLLLVVAPVITAVAAAAIVAVTTFGATRCLLRLRFSLDRPSFRR